MGGHPVTPRLAGPEGNPCDAVYRRPRADGCRGGRLAVATGRKEAYDKAVQTAEDATEVAEQATQEADRASREATQQSQTADRATRERYGWPSS